MSVDTFLHSFTTFGNKLAIIANEQEFSYEQLRQKIIELENELFETKKITPGTIIAIKGDYSFDTISLFFTLSANQCIIVPLPDKNQDEVIRIAQVEFIINVNDSFKITKTENTVDHDLLLDLKKEKHSGMILFSSGSAGTPKANVRDLSLYFSNFSSIKAKPKRTIVFMLFDHIGGINSMLFILSSGGTIVTLKDRLPETVLSAIDKYNVQALPTTPTFLNLLLLNESYKNYDISSLETISYGAEPMPEYTLRKFNSLFPNIKLLQTYGLSEIGIFKSESKASDSIWMKIGGKGFTYRIQSGLLEVKAPSQMKGYLNAPNPFTEDGWFKTGDIAEVEGDYIRILGRQSELINVGGEKVYPSEIEGVIHQMDGIVDVLICGIPNAIVGNLIKATVKLSTGENKSEFRKRMKEYLADRLPNHKIPSKLEITDKDFHGARYKKTRKLIDNNFSL